MDYKLERTIKCGIFTLASALLFIFAASLSETKSADKTALYIGAGLFGVCAFCINDD